MADKPIKKQCNVDTRVEITNFYDDHGYMATCRQYPYISKSTLYNWLTRRKDPKKTLHPDSRRPHKIKDSMVDLFYHPIIQYKQCHPNCSCVQIQRYFVSNRKYKKISISTIWRALQKAEQIKRLANVLESLRIKKLTDS